MRNIPKIFAGYSDGAVGPVARSHGLDSLLDLQTIVRLKNHPEEIEAQIARYRLDRKSFDISKDAQQKWASFDAALSRAGQKIESALGRNLVSLAPGLKKFSDDAVNLISAFINSGAVTNALRGIEGGLRRLDGAIGSAEFKRNGKIFLEGMDRLSGLAPLLISWAQIEGVAGAIGLGGLLRSGKLAGVNAATLAATGGLLERALTGHWNDPLTGPNKKLAQDLGLEPRDSGPSRPTVPRSLLRRAAPPDYPHPRPPSEVKTEGGNIVLPAVTDQNRARRNTGTITIPGEDGKPHTYSFVTGGGGRGSAPTGTYDVGEFATGGAIGDRWTLTEVGQPHDTAFDPALNAERSALRIHMAHGDRTLGCIGILGGDRVFADFENNLMYVIKKNGGHVRLRLGSPDANSITSRMTPTPNAPPSIRHPHSTGRMPIGAPMDLLGATPPRAVGESLHYDNDVGLRNMALRQRGRALHILDHMDLGPPPGPIIVHNQTGGSAQVTVSRHMATQ